MRRHFSLAAKAPAHVQLGPGEATGLAFALWQGSNAERAGQKSVTPGFLSAMLAP